jgi:hypothetical protein
LVQNRKILMAKNSQLFELVKSLSKSEKRYFKLFCRQYNSGSNYLKLFEAIDAQNEYDETTIKKKFRKETFCKQLHVTKNYLHHFILKSLRNFHSELSKDSELKDTLRNVEILYHKELYDHCTLELKKAETIARHYEINSGLAEVIGWKRKMAQAKHSQQFNLFIELLTEQEKAIAAMSNTNLHWQNAVQTSYTVMSNVAASKKIIPRHKKATLENAETLEAKVLYFNTNYLTAIRNGLHDKAAKSLSDLLDLIEKYPHRIKEDPALYISSANNLVSFYVFSKQYEKAVALISRSRSLHEEAIQQHQKKSLLKQLLRTYNIELEIYRDTRSFDKNLSFIEHIEDFITRHLAKIPSDYLLSFWFQLANIHFMRKDFDRSLKWVNHILNRRFPQAQAELQVQARMLNLVIHLEQDNLFVLRYFTDNTRRFLKKLKQVQPFEQILLSFFSKIGQVPKYEQKDQFRQLQQQLFSPGNEMLPASVLDYIDYKKWIEDKLKR